MINESEKWSSTGDIAEHAKVHKVTVQNCISKVEMDYKDDCRLNSGGICRQCKMRG